MSINPPHEDKINNCSCNVQMHLFNGQFSELSLMWWNVASSEKEQSPPPPPPPPYSVYFFFSSSLSFPFVLSFLLVLLDSRSNCRENIWNRPHIFLCSSVTGSSTLASCEYFRSYSRWDETPSPFQDRWKQNEITFLSNAPDFHKNIAIFSVG